MAAAGDQLHRPHAQPEPQGAAYVRREGDQGERGDEGLSDGHLLAQAQLNHREVFPLPTTKEFSIHLSENVDFKEKTTTFTWYTFVDLQGFGQFDSTVPSNILSKSIETADLL